MIFSGKFSKSQLGCCESTAHPISSAVPALVAELHMDDLHVSGPHDVLRKLKGDVSARLSVKYAMIFRAGASSTFKHLRRERLATLEYCYVRATIKDVKRAASLLGLEKIELASTHLAANERYDASRLD